MTNREENLIAAIIVFSALVFVLGYFFLIVTSR